MANPIALAAALTRVRPIKCPYCGHSKVVNREPKAFRVCPRCHRHFPDPFAKKKKR